MKKKIIIPLLLTIIVIAVITGYYSVQYLTTPTPDIPNEFTATKITVTRVDLTWVKAKNADTTYIERNNITTWKRGEGVMIYNDTGEHYLDIIPAFSHYFYQAWSWNQTTHTYSGSSATTNITAPANQPPKLGFQNPANGTVDTPLNLAWSVYISDQEGNPITWSIQCSNKQTTSGTNSINGTKVIHLTELQKATTYTIWVNATDPSGSGGSTRGWYLFTTASNQTAINDPPVITTPIPANGSTGNLLSLTWGVLISDPEGDRLTWTIQCSNKQNMSGINSANGTKNLILSNLLSQTTYKVWVNATDPTGSNLYTRKWYTFTTKTTPINNTPPVFGTPSPTNESIGNPLIVAWNIPIRDPNGNTFNWSIQCNGKTNNATGATNGTKILTLTGLTNGTTYKVWVNATDPTGSRLYTRHWYTFTTQLTTIMNTPPVFGTPIPANGSTQNPLSLTWSIPISDPQADLFSWTIHCSNGQTTSGTNAANGTKTISLSNLTYATSYTVWVNATDPTGNGSYTRKWYTFTTKTNLPPTFGATTPTNGSTNILLNLTWSILITDLENDLFAWSIQCNNGQSNSSTNATNGTKTLTLSALAYGTIYKVWVNATDSSGSGLFTRKWYTFTTKTNLPPIFEKPSPANNSKNTTLSFDWSIVISDPEGNLFNWTIQCNGQTANGSVETNGTKTLTITNLAYGASYKVWVNATDPTGSNRYTRRWYLFSTLANLPPDAPTIIGPLNATVRESTTYNFTTADPENENVYYFIDWGDKTNSSWIGPYASGAIITQTHTWSRRGTYIIKAKAKDSNNYESDWATLSITMPFSFNIPHQMFLERLLQRFPHAFPILRLLLRY